MVVATLLLFGFEIRALSEDGTWDEILVVLLPRLMLLERSI